MRVECEVEETEEIGDHGGPVPSVCVTCGRCDHSVVIYGTSDASVRRGLATLRDECPEGENNYYVAEDE